LYAAIQLPDAKITSCQLSIKFSHLPSLPTTCLQQLTASMSTKVFSTQHAKKSKFTINKNVYTKFLYSIG